MTKSIKKWQVAILGVVVAGVVVMLTLAVPYIVFNAVGTTGVSRQKVIVLIDKATGKELCIPKQNYGYPPELSKDKCYIKEDIVDLAKEFKNSLEGYAVDIIGDVIFINKNGEEYYYIRKVGNENVNNQGFEYRTSNTANLLVKTENLPQQTIYLPYHLLQIDRNLRDDSKILSGFIEEGQQYRTRVPYSEVVEFYKAYPNFEVVDNYDNIRVSCNESQFRVIKVAEKSIRYDLIDCVAIK